ncbi:MAG: cytochrome-c peroxidase [Nitrospinae bacterium]|nr:cytochrome-c peroxidase [Nitrospinota bacterium]
MGKTGGYFFVLALSLVFLSPTRPLYAQGVGGVSMEKVELGRLLFFDKRLSVDDTVSCATCHDPARAYTDNETVSTGIKGLKGGRNAPTVINRVFGTLQFWDGRAGSLEEQAKGPMINPVEMGNPDHKSVVAKLGKIGYYKDKFMEIFGREINIDDLVAAIASFERTVVSDDSKFDRFSTGENCALNASEKRGMDLFAGKGRCAVCHSGIRFTDEDFHNIGVGMDKENPDLGRYKVTHNDDDKGAFKTPTLRDAASTAPYMHDGRFMTLEDVIDFYDEGGIANPNLHPVIEKLGLTVEEKKDLASFLRALGGERWRKIIVPTKFPE